MTSPRRHRSMIIAIFGTALLTIAPRKALSQAAFNPTVCTIEPATFNLMTLQRFAYKQKLKSYANTAQRMLALLRNDPCAAAQPDIANASAGIVKESLRPAAWELPLDFLIYAGLGLHPHGMRALYLRGHATAPSLIACEPDPQTTIKPIEAWRASWATGRVTDVVASNSAMLILWNEPCTRTHIAPADMVQASYTMMAHQLRPMSVSAIINQYFH